MRALSAVVVLMLVISAAVASASGAARPVSQGHYELNTPQSDWNGVWFPRWQDDASFGKGWSIHVFRRLDRFTTYSFIEAELACSRWESQHWWFDLDERTTGQPPMKIARDGSFWGNRRGELIGISYRGDRPRRTSKSPRARLTIWGRFVTRRRAVGGLVATSTDGCSVQLPFVAVYRRTGWRDLLNRL